MLAFFPFILSFQKSTKFDDANTKIANREILDEEPIERVVRSAAEVKISDFD